MQLIYPGAMALCVLATCGCATTSNVTAAAASSPVVIEGLQVVSAGHTGCLPENNQVSIIWAKPDGSGLWTATCNGKTYLCSTLATNGVSSYSCAVQVQ